MSQARGVRLLVSSGSGPAECRRAVRHVLAAIEREACKAEIGFTCAANGEDDRAGPVSALVRLTGAGRQNLAARWSGTVQWICRSPFRPHHRRRNWFVGVFAIAPDERPAVGIAAGELRFETFRAGGPGGQHQNTTDSAVRAIHQPTGLAAVGRRQRSQHRNKQEAVALLSEKLLLRRIEQEARASAAHAQLHRELERGNPVRVFRGERFREV